MLNEVLDINQKKKENTYSNVNDQDGDVTKGRTTGPEVSERLVTWSVDNEQTRDLDFVGMVL